MKILLLSSTNNVKNGYGNFTHEFCSYLHEKGYDFKLLLPKDEQRYDYTNYPVDYVLPKYIFDLKTLKIWDYITFKYETDADIVHSLFEFPYALLGERLARKNKKPFIIGTQGTYAIKPLFSMVDGFFLRRTYNNASVITAPSQFTVGCLRKYAQTKTPIKIIHNGVNFKRFDVPVEIADIIKTYEGKKLLLTVGGIKPRKGQDIVLKALALLKKERDDFHYLIVGPDEARDKYRQELANIIKENNLGNNVTFTGAVPGEDLIRYFHATNIYIHTPRLINWNFEGYGIVYLEAGACKKPIIAADAGGIRDAVLDGETGMVVEENNIDQTAKAIKTLLDDPVMAEKMGRAGYEYARDHDWSVIAMQYVNLYKELLK